MIYVADQYLSMSIWNQQNNSGDSKTSQRESNLAKIWALVDGRDQCLERREPRTKMVLESLIKAGWLGSWELCGSLLNHFWTSQGAVRGLFGVSWSHLGDSEGLLEASWESFGRSGRFGGRNFEVLGGFWEHLGSSWSALGAPWRGLGSILGGSWEYFSSTRASKWSPNWPKSHSKAHGVLNHLPKQNFHRFLLLFLECSILHEISATC